MKTKNWRNSRKCEKVYHGEKRKNQRSKRTTEYGWSTKVGVTVVFCRAHCSRRTTFWVSLPTNCSYVKIARRSKKIGVTKTFEAVYT